MSIVTIQLGQAGNQVGVDFFDALLDDGASPALVAAFFRPAGPMLLARAVIVDTEPKVIASVMARARKTGRWLYDKANQFCQQRGAGNNWANGYHNYGEATADAVMRLVQAEVDQCDAFAGFLILTSVAGGTGSGLGTRVTELIRQEYPHSFILNQIVWPYSTGEVIVQNYNALLSLTRLYAASDGVILIRNDDVHEVCTRMHHLKTVTFRDMNRVIGRSLAAVLKPARVATLEGGRPNGRGRSAELADLIKHLCPHPDYKLLTTRTVPQMPDTHREYTNYQWPGMVKTLRQMLIAGAPCEEGINWSVSQRSKGLVGSRFNVSLANLVVVRGKETAKADLSAFADPGLYSEWSPDPLAVWASVETVGRHEKSVSLLSNSQSVLGPVDTVTAKAWQMFGSRAYVHQYQRFGLTEDDFVDTFVKAEQIVKSYADL